MKPGKHIERLAKSLLLAPKILLRYGTLSPTKVCFNGCENWIYVDPNDRRVIKKFVHDPIRKRISPPLSFWRDFLAKLEPSVAMDVGVNYGECIFGTRYGSMTKVYGFEANPRIVPYLRKSRLDHPDVDRIIIVEGLVSNKIEDEIPFYSNPSWSGTGSAVRSLNDSENLIATPVSSRTIDSVIPRKEVEGGTLLFKMDIEGYESHAFEGFWQTVSSAKLVVGLIEFDTTYIREAGTNSEEYFASLSNRFDIYCLSADCKKTLIRAHGIKSLLVSRAADGRVHTDLVLSTRGVDPAAWLPNNWSIKTS